MVLNHFNIQINLLILLCNNIILDNRSHLMLAKILSLVKTLTYMYVHCMYFSPILFANYFTYDYINNQEWK